MAAVVVIGAAILALCSVAVLIIMGRVSRREEELYKKSKRRKK